MLEKLCLKSKSDMNSESDKKNELKSSTYSDDWEEGIILFFCYKSLRLPSPSKQKQTPSRNKSFCKAEEMGHFNKCIVNTLIQCATFI